MQKNKPLVALLALFAALPLANAIPICGFGSPDSNAALTGGTVVDFDSGPTGALWSATYGDFKISGVDAKLTIGSAFICEYNNFGVNSVMNGLSLVPNSFRFDFASPVDAFGFNWGAADIPWTLNAYSASGTLIETTLLSATHSSNEGHYFGIAASGISYATLSGYMDYVFIDNVTYQSSGSALQAQSVPDSGSTLGLFGLALAGFVVVRKLKPAVA